MTSSNNVSKFALSFVSKYINITIIGNSNNHNNKSYGMKKVLYGYHIGKTNENGNSNKIISMFVLDIQWANKFHVGKLQIINPLEPIVDTNGNIRHLGKHIFVIAIRDCKINLSFALFMGNTISKSTPYIFMI